MKNNILQSIVDDKHHQLNEQKASLPLAFIQENIAPSGRHFYQTLFEKKNKNECIFILECKKASPSKGLIRTEFDLQAIAQAYSPYATAISVLTDEKYFQGRFEYLNVVSQTVSQPILCKDFIIDAYQVYLARYHQADAILLMLSILSDEEYLHLANIAHSLNMGVLTEAITVDEVKRAAQLGAQVVDINNRDLHDLSIDMDRVKKLAPLLPKKTIVISASGIHQHQTIKALRPYADGFLIGSSLMEEKHLETAVKELIVGSHKVCGLTRIEDAQAAYHAGASYGGLIFAKHSPRYIDEAHASLLVQSTPLKWVGVFVNETLEHVLHLTQQLQLSAVQLHGQENDDYIKTLKTQLQQQGLYTQIWKAHAVKDSLPHMDNSQVDIHLLDCGSGGTGESFNWDLLQGQTLNNIMVAGGIQQSNIQKALGLNAYGLDLNSGLEFAPGVKNAHKISDIFSTIKTY